VDSIFARFPGIVGSISLVKYTAASLLEQQNTAISPFKT
jgi:hypothetical protein